MKVIVSIYSLVDKELNKHIINLYQNEPESFVEKLVELFKVLHEDKESFFWECVLSKLLDGRGS